MSRRYNITKQLSFSDDTGYWNLYIEVNNSEGVSPKPFLLEKYVSSGDSLATSSNTVNYVRCLLRNEPIEVPEESDTTLRSRDSWVMFRSHVINRSFYTYESASYALDSILSILKSNTERFESLRPKKMPKLIAINMSSKDKIPSSSSIEAYKGDVIALQLINGPTSTMVISDNDFMGVGGLSVKRRVSNSVSVKILGDSHTYLGLRDSNTGTQYTISITMLGTSETSVTEEI